MTPDEILSRLLYRDGLMLVLDKPAGMAVHRGPKGGESLEDYFDALRFGLPRAPALAHRLDRDTSGCLVLGRHRKALAALGKLFKSGRVGKTYWAVVEGRPMDDEGRIDIPLGRLDETRGWWMKPDPKGQPAVTVWKVMGRSHSVSSPAGQPSSARAELGLRSAGRGRIDPTSAGGTGRGEVTNDGARGGPLPDPPPQAGEGTRSSPGEVGASQLAWLALEPRTGRTHQLRVHCAEMGWPIVGDAIYGTAPRVGGPILHLHAREIVVPLSKNRPPIRVTAPLPEHMRERLRACGWRGEDAPQPVESPLVASAQ